MDRRDFLKGVAITGAVASVAPRTIAVSDIDSRVLKVSAFNYEGNRLRDSRWKEQYDQGRDFYLNVNNDDILHGYRLAAGMPAPGKPLGGWCAKNSNTVFGQWLSGMARMYHATNDTEIRDKASYLLSEFVKTVGPDGSPGMTPYPYEKLVCGLVDMHEFVGHPEAMPLLQGSQTGRAKTSIVPVPPPIPSRGRCIPVSRWSGTHFPRTSIERFSSLVISNSRILQTSGCTTLTGASSRTLPRRPRRPESTLTVT